MFSGAHATMDRLYLSSNIAIFLGSPLIDFVNPARLTAIGLYFYFDHINFCFFIICKMTTLFIDSGVRSNSR